MTNVHNNTLQRPRSLVALLALLALLFAGVAPRPAQADGAASTRNIILGAAAAVAGIIIYNNVAHKHAAARNDVVGYTRDGGLVHRDGRITYPNGRTLYVSNGNGRPCGYDDEHERCGVRPVAYYRSGDRDRDDWRHRNDHGRYAHRQHGEYQDRHDHGDRGHHDEGDRG